jgi:hypothetical protein
MAKTIKVNVLKDSYNILEVLEVENGKNFRYVATPDKDIDSLEGIVADIAKELWTEELKEAYGVFLEAEHERLMKQFETPEETNE